MYEHADKWFKYGKELRQQEKKQESFDAFMHYASLYENIKKTNPIRCEQYIDLRTNVLGCITILETLKKEIEEKKAQKLMQQLEKRWEKFQTYSNKHYPIIAKASCSDGSNIKKNFLRNKNKETDPLTALETNLKLWGLRLHNVPGDNKCQFHALCDQLKLLNIDKNMNVTNMREKLVAWLKKNGSRKLDDGENSVSDFIGIDNWVEYLNDMSDENTWGDEATLLAASCTFKVKIVIISSLSPEYCHTIAPPKMWNIDIKGILYLGHLHEFHYTSTRIN